MDVPVNILTLHRDAVRHAFFMGNLARNPFFDETAKAWIVTNPAHCKELIASGALRPATYTEDYQVLQHRLGLDFSSMTVAFDAIPLCQHGASHERARRRVSEFLAKRKAALNAAIPDAIDRYFAAMRHEGRVELMAACIDPLVRDIICTVADIDVACVADCAVASVPMLLLTCCICSRLLNCANWAMNSLSSMGFKGSWLLICARSNFMKSSLPRPFGVPSSDALAFAVAAETAAGSPSFARVASSSNLVLASAEVPIPVPLRFAVIGDGIVTPWVDESHDEGALPPTSGPHDERMCDWSLVELLIW